jgi:high-affinity iron transporter
MWLPFMGCSGVDRDLPPAYRRVEVPQARLDSAAAVRHGHQLFLEHCALCHGQRGDGHGERAEGLSTKPADFTSPAWRRQVSPRRVFYTIREGVHGTAMPSWKALDESDAWDLAAYVLSVAGERS